MSSNALQSNPNTTLAVPKKREAVQNGSCDAHKSRKDKRVQHSCAEISDAAANYSSTAHMEVVTLVVVMQPFRLHFRPSSCDAHDRRYTQDDDDVYMCQVAP